MNHLAPLPGRTGTDAARRAWDAAALAEQQAWRVVVPEAVVEEFAARCRRRPGDVADVDAFAFDAVELPAFAAWTARVRRTLIMQEGLCWVQGLAASGLTAAERRLFYVASGCALGTPMTQYGRIYEVRDRGASYKDSAVPVSMTNAETGFHTDSSARDVVPDFVGLLCERPSLTGGESLVSNALRAYRALAQLEQLGRFRGDSRGLAPCEWAPFGDWRRC